MSNSTVDSIKLVARLRNNTSSVQVRQGTVLRLGRAPAEGWALPTDVQISREHADLLWNGKTLAVTCTAAAVNPIIWHGPALREIEISPGDEFRIGSTNFRLDGPAPKGRARASGVSEASNKDELSELTYPTEDLEQFEFGDPARQIELLSTLPQVITSTQTDVELAHAVAGILLKAISPAIAVAVVQYDDEVVKRFRTGMLGELPDPMVMRVQTRDDYGGRFMPSQRLLARSMRLGEGTVHVWAEQTAGEFTLSENLSWAFCIPMTSESCLGWCLYVAGAGNRQGGMAITEDDLKGDLRFTNLLAQFICSIREVRVLQEQKTQLSSFFSPNVVQSLSWKASDQMLEPSELDITVLFCDVHGFSRKSEECRNDLRQLLQCTRTALGAMTGGILQFDGTIADFQGDAALGFWGWPVPCEDGPVPACLAALSILSEFSKPPEEQGPLEGFTVGIGIAHGQAIAGQIGTLQQAKVGVFGPVVNQGARLESLTRQLGVQICIDEATARGAAGRISPDLARIRRLACIHPKGMLDRVMVSEILPTGPNTKAITDAMLQDHEGAVDAVVSGRWTEAREILAGLPDSGPKSFLLSQMERLGNEAPSDWDGAFFLADK